LLQFTNNTIQGNRGTFPLITIESVGRKLSFTGNLIENNTEQESDGPDGDYYYYYGVGNDDLLPVVELASFRYTTDVSLKHNRFINPSATHELSVNLRQPPSFILDLGLNFWHQTNYSAVIRR